MLYVEDSLFFNWCKKTGRLFFYTLKQGFLYRMGRTVFLHSLAVSYKITVVVGAMAVYLRESLVYRIIFFRKMK